MKTVKFLTCFEVEKKTFLYLLITFDIILCILDITNSLVNFNHPNLRTTFISTILIDTLTIIYCLVTLYIFLKRKKNSKFLQIFNYYRIFFYLVTILLLVAFIFYFNLGDKIENLEFIWESKIFYTIYLSILTIWCVFNLFWSFTLKNITFEQEEEEMQFKEI